MEVSQGSRTPTSELKSTGMVRRNLHQPSIHDKVHSDESESINPDEVDLTTDEPFDLEQLKIEAGVHDPTIPVSKIATDACLTLAMPHEDVPEDIQHVCLNRIKEFARTSEGRMYVVELDGIAKILTLLMDLSIMNVVTSIILNLSFPDIMHPEVVKALDEENVVEKMFWTIEISASLPKFVRDTTQEHAISTITNLTFTLPSSGSELCRHVGNLEQLARCMTRGSGQVQMAGCKLIAVVMLDQDRSLNGQNISQMAGSSVPLALMKTLQPEGKDDLIQRACKCLEVFLKDMNYQAVNDVAFKFDLPKVLNEVINSYNNFFGFTKAAHDVTVEHLRKVLVLCEELAPITLDRIELEASTIEQMEPQEQEPTDLTEHESELHEDEPLPLIEDLAMEPIEDEIESPQNQQQRKEQERKQEELKRQREYEQQQQLQRQQRLQHQQQYEQYHQQQQQQQQQQEASVTPTLQLEQQPQPVVHTVTQPSITTTSSSSTSTTPVVAKSLTRRSLTSVKKKPRRSMPAKKAKRKVTL